MECKYCGYEVEEGAKFCPHCGNAVETKVKKPSVRKVTETINSLTGEEGSIEIHFKDLFTEIFKRHTRKEMEDLFICGTEKTTPSERSMVVEWPKPWLHTRVFICLLAMTVLLAVMNRLLNNIFATPSLLFMSGLLIPFSLMIFFWECNVPRNISFFQCIVMFFLGGVIVWIVNMSMERGIHADGAVVFNILLSLVQMIPLMLIIILVVRMTGPKYILNGLCLGSTIAAGYGMLVLVGRMYTYEVDFSTGFLFFDQKTLTDYILYVVHAVCVVHMGAMIGGGAVSAMDGKPFTWDSLKNIKFYVFAGVALLLSMIYAVGTYGFNNRFVRYIVLAVSLVIVLIQISAGLKQCVRISGAAWERMSAEAEETEEEA